MIFIKQWLNFQHYNMCPKKSAVVYFSPAVSACCLLFIHHLFSLLISWQTKILPHIRFKTQRSTQNLTNFVFLAGATRSVYASRRATDDVNVKAISNCISCFPPFCSTVVDQNLTFCYARTYSLKRHTTTLRHFFKIVILQNKQSHQIPFTLFLS